jgi:hypothetical protein
MSCHVPKGHDEIQHKEETHLPAGSYMHRQTPDSLQRPTDKVSESFHVLETVIDALTAGLNMF